MCCHVVGRQVCMVGMCCHACHVVGRHVRMVGMCCHACHVVGRHALMVGMCCHGCHVVGRHALMLGMWCHVVEGSSRFRGSCTWVSGSGRGKDAQFEGESRLACVEEKVVGNDVVNPEPHLIRAMRHRGLPVVDLEDEEELVPDPGRCRCRRSCGTGRAGGAGRNRRLVCSVE